MTNEELMQRLSNGEDVAETLYLQNEGLIAEIAKKALASFQCLKYDGISMTAHSHYLFTELNQEGAAEFFRLLRAGKYDASKGKFTTYVYPHLEGVMRRWMEKNLAQVVLDEEVTLEDVMDFPSISPRTTDQIVYRKICMELLQELFLSLPEKDRFILGHATGAFGYERLPLDEIALREEMTVGGVSKARDAAMRKLKERYAGSKLQLWHTVHREVLRIAEE